MSDDACVCAVVDHARGVLAERFGVEIGVADGILNGVARAQLRDVAELATAIVESCTTDSTPLPRTLYSNGSEAA